MDSLGENSLACTTIWVTCVNQDGKSLLKVKAKSSRIDIYIWECRPCKLSLNCYANQSGYSSVFPKDVVGNVCVKVSVPC